MMEESEIGISWFDVKAHPYILQAFRGKCNNNYYARAHFCNVILNNNFYCITVDYTLQQLSFRCTGYLGINMKCIKCSTV